MRLPGGGGRGSLRLRRASRSGGAAPGTGRTGRL